MIEKAIDSLLRSNATLTALVSGRIYPMIRDQADGLPAVTFQIISAPRLHAFDGPIGMVQARIQINCFAADDPLGAANISEIIRKAFDGFQGSPADVRIEALLIEDLSDLPVIVPENERQNVYAKTMDFIVTYKE